MGKATKLIVDKQPTLNINDLVAYCNELEDINEKLSLALESAENKIDKTIKHVSSLSSKGRDCRIYANVKKDILDILKGN